MNFASLLRTILHGVMLAATLWLGACGDSSDDKAKVLEARISRLNQIEAHLEGKMVGLREGLLSQREGRSEVDLGHIAGLLREYLSEGEKLRVESADAQRRNLAQGRLNSNLSMAQFLLAEINGEQIRRAMNPVPQQNPQVLERVAREQEGRELQAAREQAERDLQIARDQEERQRAARTERDRLIRAAEEVVMWHNVQARNIEIEDLKGEFARRNLPLSQFDGARLQSVMGGSSENELFELRAKLLRIQSLLRVNIDTLLTLSGRHEFEHRVAAALRLGQDRVTEGAASANLIFVQARVTEMETEREAQRGGGH